MESYGRIGPQLWMNPLYTFMSQRAYGTDTPDPVVCVSAVLAFHHTLGTTPAAP